MTWISELHHGKRLRLQEVYEGPRGDRVREHIKPDDGDFGIWMMLVDMAIRRELDVGAFDLGEQPWHDKFDTGMAPGLAANEVVGVRAIED